MKSLDRYLRDVRIAKAKTYLREGDRVVDVGCGDGELFRQLSGQLGHCVGIDPLIDKTEQTAEYTLIPGLFPQALPRGVSCDAITMLAVLEHLPPTEQAKLADVCAGLLSSGGRIVITVPSPRVDQILHVLLWLRLIDGIAVHEHYGFKPADTPGIFPAPRFRLLVRRRFQFGLNNLFVFEKTA